jgi:rhodanese-related sulfurtransferase
MLGFGQSAEFKRGAGLAAGLAALQLLTACSVLVQTDVSPQNTACSGVQDSSALRTVHFRQAPLQPYTSAERACWIDWDGARQLAAQGAQWVDVRETVVAQRLRLIGALAVPREALANNAALRERDLLILDDGVDLRALSRQCLAWRQSGRFRGVHVVLGGVRAWRLAGQPVQPDPHASAAPEPPDTITPAQYRKGLADGLWRVVTLGVDPGQTHGLDYPVTLAIPAADADALRTLPQALAPTGKDKTVSGTIEQSWLAVTADAAEQARLQALWNRQQSATAGASGSGQTGRVAYVSPAPTLLWLGGGLRAYRDYLTEQRQLAAHAGHALPRVCGL